MEEVIRLLNSVRPLSPELEAHLRGILRKYTYRKGAKLLRSGEVAAHILFVNKGLVRSYSDLKGKKVTQWFMKEGDIIISVVSFLRQQPAEEWIEALEASECWGITHAELEETYARFPEFNLHGRLITSEYYCRSEERHRSQRRQTPEDKYALMMQNDPDLIARAPNKHMASFLNVGSRTYAYIRKDYAERKPRR
jgi:CRP/FNR family transcriptional regulator, anaerobic regulatory protein